MALRGKLLALLSAAGMVYGHTPDVKLSAAKVYLGEPVRLSYTFSYKPDEGIDFRFAAPELAHFQVLQSRTAETREGEKEVWTKTYVVAPMQNGPLSTGAAAMNVAKRIYEKDRWGQWMPAVKWEQRRFEEAELFVKPVPPSVQAVGRFRLSAVTDTNTTESGAPVRLTLTLRGCGNLQMAEPLRMAVAGVSVFEAGSSRRAAWRGECFESESNRTFALVGERDFTIPSVTFRYFDPEKGAVETTLSPPIPIRVKASAPQALPVFKREEEAMMIWSTALGAAAGFGFGVAATLLFLRRKKTQRLVRYDSLRAALVALFGHLEDPEAKQSAEAVEKHLYEGAEKPDGAAISKLLSRLKNERRR